MYECIHLTEMLKDTLKLKYLKIYLKKVVLKDNSSLQQQQHNLIPVATSKFTFFLYKHSYLV